MQTLRAKPAWMILFVLLALALLSGVVYAVSRSLGYIPGVGMVEQGAPIRVLAEPVTLTREGMTVTVTSATLAPDKTVITYTIENVPWEALSHQEDVPGCYAEGQIRLPNGSLLVPQSGGGGMSAEGKWETRMVYSAIPPQFNEAEFLLDCIQGTLPGKAPENWRLSLRFVPAPPDLTIVPVVEIATPTPAPQAIGAATPAEGLILEKVIETGSGYILVGKFRASGLPTNAQPLGFSQWPRVTDANGVELPYRTANDVDAISATMGEFPWTLEILGKEQAWPLTIHLEAVDAQAFDLSAQFIFDTGPNPQPGQEWLVNQNVPLGDFTVRVEKVTFTGAGYSFEMSAPPEVRSVNLEILDTNPISGSGGNDGRGRLTASVDYDQPPTGPLNIRLYAPTLTIRGGWSLQWQPENAPQPQSLYGIRLVLDKFIPLEDGYYLIGHTESDDGRIVKVTPADLLTATDASGRRLALEMVTFSEMMQLTTEISDTLWAYKLYGKAFEGDVTLRLGKVNVQLAQPVPLTLDLRPMGFSFETARVGTPFKTGLIPLDFPGLSAQLYKATVFQQGDLRGFELAFQADPRLDGIVFEMEHGGSAMSNSYRDPQSGDLLVQAATDPAPPMPFRLTATELRLKGDWNVSWTPPAPPAGATPFYAPQACLRLDSVKQAFANPPTPPPLKGRLLLMRGALYPQPSLFLRDLASGNETPLVFGQGSLSPDGAKLAYSDQQNRLLLRDLATGTETALTDGAQPDFAPLWSPDGTRLAFLRRTANGSNVFVLNLAKGAPRPLTDQTHEITLSGWADNQTLLIQDAASIELLNVADGARRPLLQTRYNPYGTPSAAISPDGTTLAYLEQVPGAMTPGLYLKPLPDGEPRLLAQLEHWAVFNPLFSLDSRWLLFSIMNTDLPDTPVTPALVSLADWPGSCPLYPLPFTGQAREWQP